MSVTSLVSSEIWEYKLIAPLFFVSGRPPSDFIVTAEGGAEIS